MLLGCSVFTLKMLNMLLCWRCCYAEDAATLKMLKMLLCWNGCLCISPMLLWGIMTFLWDPWEHWNSINTQFYWFLRKQHKMKNLKNLKLVKTADNIYTPGMLSACWSRSMCYHVPWRPQNTVKGTEQWHFQTFLQLHFNCVPGNLKPLSWLYTVLYHIILYIYHIISYYIILLCIILYHIILYYIIWSYNMLFYGISNYSIHFYFKLHRYYIICVTHSRCVYIDNYPHSTSFYIILHHSTSFYCTSFYIMFIFISIHIYILSNIAYVANIHPILSWHL